MIRQTFIWMNFSEEKWNFSALENSESICETLKTIAPSQAISISNAHWNRHVFSFYCFGIGMYYSQFGTAISEMWNSNQFSRRKDFVILLIRLIHRKCSRMSNYDFYKYFSVFPLQLS